MRYTLLGLALIACSGCDFIGGADTLIRGSHNFIARDGNAEAVAKSLAEFESVPPVSDEDLLVIYSTLRTEARAGNLEAIQVMLRLASIQRAAAAEAAAEAEES